MSTGKLMEELQNPPEEFTPVPFWFFNDRPDKKRIRRQLADYVDKGVNGLVLHPRIGLPEDIPYLSDAYFEAVRYIVETAAELSMKVVLYDEGMYPSGSAHGMVAAANPEYAAKGITITDKPGADTVIAALTDGRFLVKRKTGGTIRGIHFGEDDGEAGAPAAADILNPDAVKLFIRLTHERYYEELKEYFGNTIMGFFTDEPCALGRCAEGYREWADGMEREITEAGGSPAELEGLFTGEENAATAIYHRLIKKRLREIFYGELHSWCEAHGIWLMGHPAQSDDVEEELYFDVPGQDLIMRRVSPESGGLLEPDSVQAKLAADIARHLRRRRNSNECFGVCCRQQIPWYFTGRDMKWYVNWLGIRGVNLFIPHAFYYSVDGKRKEERPPDVGPNNIWWKHYRLFSDYMKRISYVMTDSANNAKIAVLCDNNRIPCREIAAFYENQVEFHYLPAALISKGQAENGILKIGEYRYEAALNVLGEEYDSLLSGVKVCRKADELLGERFRAAWTDKPCPCLRAAHLYKEETEILLLSNEGEERIRTRLHIPGGHAFMGYDLWKNRFYPMKAECGEDGAGLEIELMPCEMMAILCNAEDGLPGTEAAKAPQTELAGMVRPGRENWNGRFALISRQDNRAEYAYSFSGRETAGSGTFEVTGEEMAECYCNGKLAGVSFYSPHLFETEDFLREGENEIRLVFTGNAANIYDKAGLFYGLGKPEGSFK